ncbi:MAG: nucleotidyltransferase domain-containing protein [Bacteroidales bacterium]|nr:nucleotidyltransferase domain-containing protein [Bacteroidales bacterium]
MAMGKKALIQIIANYFKTQPVLKAWLFGSFARGEETEKSDVDIIVSLDYSQRIGLKYFKMAADLEKLVGRPVDLVEDGMLLPFANKTTEKDKTLIYERKS